jgi:hypothetical protein
VSVPHAVSASSKTSGASLATPCISLLLTSASPDRV